MFRRISVSSSSKQKGTNESIHSFLIDWGTKFNISNLALDELLLEFHKKGYTNLPRCTKTLMKVPRLIRCVETIGDGIYCHPGIEKCLSAYCCALKKNGLPIPNEIVLDFNMDGVNYSKSTNCSLWLIQMSLRKVELNPFVIGIYYEKTKPPCNDFLKYFVNEIEILIIDGFHFNRDVVLIELGSICNDTPANSFVRASKGHAGYYSCVNCTQKGQKLDSCMVFPPVEAAFRTDADFRERMQPGHHVGESIIENIPKIDMIKSFAIDEMHVVHLGVVKKLIKFWLDSSSNLQKKTIERKISVIEQYRPKEIHRTIRNLLNFNQFKATEFRTFLLFTGPVILLGVIDQKKYDHFMILHIAMKILAQKNCLDKISKVRPLLKKFVVDFRKIYGLNKLTYVVHSLLHLCDDVQQHGSLQSAYRFENSSGKIVRKIRHGKNVAQQLNNRVLEQLKVISLPIKEPFRFGRKFKCQSAEKYCFRQIIINGIQIDTTKRNQWFLTTNKEIYSFNYAVSFDEISCKKFECPSNQSPSFSESPVESIDLDIFYVEGEIKFSEDKLVDLSNIYAKMFVMPVKQRHVFFPIYI